MLLNHTEKNTSGIEHVKDSLLSQRYHILCGTQKRPDNVTINSQTVTIPSLHSVTYMHCKCTASWTLRQLIVMNMYHSNLQQGIGTHYIMCFDLTQVELEYALCAMKMDRLPTIT